MIKNNFSILFLILSNLVPVYGVLYLGWDYKAILFVYWLENLVIGFWTVIKLSLVSKFSSFSIVPFFIFHYGAFTFGHLIFLLALFATNFKFGEIPIESFFNINLPKNLYISFIALMISHGFSFFLNFVGKMEYKSATKGQVMWNVYKRVMVMHFTLIGGAFLTSFFGLPVYTLFLLIFLKIVLDVRAHIAEHSLQLKAANI